MNVNHMKNIIVLKDLPSNVVDEAIVILKNTAKLRVKSDFAETHIESREEQEKEEGFSESAIKEAEFLITNYLKKLEKHTEKEGTSIRKMRLECKKFKMYTAVLGIISAICISLCIFG